jgi:aerobic-type carbon monoxide dehydrogenase small subunit (CoxS/CutS family)
MSVDPGAPRPLVADPHERMSLHLTVNGRRVSARAEPRELLSDFIRHTLGLTGTHVGCEHGVCGACTVRVGGELVRSCLMLAVQADGAQIATIEGVADGADLHPIQRAFQAAHGLQCGFCTPAIVLTVQKLVEENPDPGDDEIREYLSGNVCRCTGYAGIVDAARLAARERVL